MRRRSPTGPAWAIGILGLCLAACRAAAEPVLLDFGTADSPVAAGFARVTPDLTPAQGAVWEPVRLAGEETIPVGVDAPVDPNPRVSGYSGRTVRPDVYTNDLTRDHIEGDAAMVLRLRVPAGRYRFVAVTGASGPGPGGSNTHRVWDTSIELCGVRLGATFPGPYETRILQADVNTAGPIDIRVGTRNRWLLNALALVPVAEWDSVHRDVLAPYEQDIELLPAEVLATWEHRPHVDETPMPSFSEASRDRGFAVYSRSYLSCIWPNTVPLARELDREVRAFASRGEYEPLTFTILPFRDLSRVEVRFSDLVSKGGDRVLSDAIDVRRVRYMWVKPNYITEGIYYRAPDVLMPFAEPRDLPEGENFRVWATVRVGRRAPEGVYSGRADIVVDGDVAGTVPVRLRVVPITLEQDSGTTYALYYRHPYDSVGRAPDAFSRDWYHRRAEAEHRDLVAHGMNGITLSCWSPAPKDGAFLFDFDALADKIDLLRAHGMLRPLPLSIPTFSTYSEYIKDPVQSHLRGIRTPPPAFFETVTAMVEAIEAERRIRQWPEFLYYPVDEPSTHPDAVAFMVGVLKAIKRVPGVRTYITADPSHEQFDPMRPFVDIWCCQPFTPGYDEVTANMRERPGLEYWCYPNHVNGENDHTPVTGARMTYGFGFRRSGFRALIPWIYSSSSGNPWNYLDSGAMDFFNRTDDDGSPIPVAMYEAYREGIDDGRYMTTLARWVERARAAGRADLAAAGESDLRFVLDAVEVREKYKYDGMWDPDAFDVYRWILAQRILELQDALARR